MNANGKADEFRPASPAAEAAAAATSWEKTDLNNIPEASITVPRDSGKAPLGKKIKYFCLKKQTYKITKN